MIMGNNYSIEKYPVIVVNTSGEDSGTGTDLSEVLLDLDLMEDLLELFFGVLVETSLESTSGSVSYCSG